MVLFDAVLHSKHEDQVASAIYLPVSELFKISVEAGMKQYAPGKMMRELFVKRTPSYFFQRARKILTETKQKCLLNKQISPLNYCVTQYSSGKF